MDNDPWKEFLTYKCPMCEFYNKEGVIFGEHLVRKHLVFGQKPAFSPTEAINKTLSPVPARATTSSSFQTSPNRLAEKRKTSDQSNFLSDQLNK